MAAERQKFKYKKLDHPIELNIPEGEMEQTYKTSFYYTQRKLADIIFDMNNPNDPRIPVITHLIISQITDDGIYSDVMKRYESFIEEEIENAKDNNGEIDNERRGLAILKACMRANHEVIAFMDKFDGITHKIVIGEI